MVFVPDPITEWWPLIYLSSKTVPLEQGWSRAIGERLWFPRSELLAVAEAERKA